MGHPLSFPIFGYLLFAAAWVGSLFAVDGYGLKVPESRVNAGVVVLKAAPLVMVTGAVFFFAEPYRITRPVILLSPFVGLIIVLAIRLTLLRLLMSTRFAKRTLLVGGEHLLPNLREALQGGRFEYRVVGGVSLTDDQIPDLPRLGPSDDLVSIIRSHRIDEIIVGSRDVGDEIIERCFVEGIRVQSAAALIERYYGRVPLDAVDAGWFLRLPDRDLMARPYPLIRRAADLVLSAVISVPFVAAIPFIALAIKLDSPGPVFFTQIRVGQHGRLFKLIKLRTMFSDAESQGFRWAEPGDRRVTRVGRVLRSCRLDEVPQVLNVLRGEMSFIGPRPEQPGLVEYLAGVLPHYQTRHAVRPGISGWAQVKGGYASSLSATALKLEYDLYYVRHQSLRLDLQIAFHTLFTVLGLRGR